MTLIDCTDCSHKISPSAKFCPNCGKVIRSKLLITLWTRTLVFLKEKAKYVRVPEDFKRLRGRTFKKVTYVRLAYVLLIILIISANAMQQKKIISENVMLEKVNEALHQDSMAHRKFILSELEYEAMLKRHIIGVKANNLAKKLEKSHYEYKNAVLNQKQREIKYKKLIKLREELHQANLEYEKVHSLIEPITKRRIRAEEYEEKN